MASAGGAGTGASEDEARLAEARARALQTATMEVLVMVTTAVPSGGGGAAAAERRDRPGGGGGWDEGDAGELEGGFDECLGGGGSGDWAGGAEGPGLLAGEPGWVEVGEVVEEGVQLVGARSGAVEAYDDGVGPEEVSLLELAVAFVGYFGGVWSGQAAEADAGFGLYGTDGDGEGELLCCFGIGLKQDQD